MRKTEETLCIRWDPGCDLPVSALSPLSLLKSQEINYTHGELDAIFHHSSLVAPVNRLLHDIHTRHGLQKENEQTRHS